MPKIDVLINNAGLMMAPLQRTADGFEMQRRLQKSGTSTISLGTHSGSVKSELSQHNEGLTGVSCWS